MNGSQSLSVIPVLFPLICSDLLASADEWSCLSRSYPCWSFISRIMVKHAGCYRTGYPCSLKLGAILENVFPFSAFLPFSYLLPFFFLLVFLWWVVDFVYFWVVEFHITQVNVVEGWLSSLFSICLLAASFCMWLIWAKGSTCLREKIGKMANLLLNTCP